VFASTSGQKNTESHSVSEESSSRSQAMANENTKFINSLFLKNLIENHYGHRDVKIKTYTVEQPSENGNTYTRASINRIFVKYSSSTASEEVISFVTKIKPTKGELSDEFKLSGDFTKEVQIYKSVVPALAKTLKKIGEKIEFTPKYCN
jgi:Ecdysteroid kinase-like family